MLGPIPADTRRLPMFFIGGCWPLAIAIESTSGVCCEPLLNLGYNLV